MTEIIIQEMSQVVISDDLLRQIDMDGLIKKFRENHARLDDFKRIRDNYEKRDVLSKVWDFVSFDKTMENAQLDAVEVQAEFSKSIGQLTVVNIALSKRLNEQQQQLAEQQNIIKKQTSTIEGQTYELEKQHATLAKQNAELEKLVNDYFELKGLTQEGAKKLIEIAKKIENTSDELTKSVSTKVQNLQDQVSGQQQEMATKMNTLENSMNEARGNILKTIEESQSSIAKQQEKTLDEVSLKIKLSDEATQKIEQAFQNYREQEYKKIKNLTIAFSTTSAILCSLVGYLLIT